MLFTGMHVRLRMFLADLAVIMLCETDFLLKYPYVYVICSVERRIIDFGLAHLNWPSTYKSNQIIYFQATRPIEKKDTETDRNTQTHTQKHKNYSSYSNENDKLVHFNHL